MKQDITIIDGGFTTVLEQKGYSLNDDPLWSARFLNTNPSVVVDVHKRYLESGSKIITTASYQASISGFQKHLGLSTDESCKLIQSSVHLAKQARQEYLENIVSNREILIAGSVGPYGAALADGSEYTGDYCDNLSCEELMEWHEPRVKHLVDAGSDIIAFETIPSMKEGEALMKLLHRFPSVKAWLSFSCKTAHKTAHGEDISVSAKTCAEIAPSGQLVAIGVNCCSPEHVCNLLKNISTGAADIPLIAYPNSGETWDSKAGWSNDKARPISDYVESWVEASARYIGGCCRTGPEDIAAIVKKLRIS